MKCVCGNKAVINLRYIGKILCESCFTTFFEKRTRRELRFLKAIQKGDKIAVAISGGKDSSCLLYMVSKVASQIPDVEIVAITIDEGIRGYREQTLESCRRLCNELDISHHLYIFEDEFEYSLDRMVKISRENDHGKNPCTYCGVFRRYLINKYARELGCNKIFTGHNLDDEAQAIMLNMMQGALKKLVRLDPLPHSIHPSIVPRIKPLRNLPEKEVALYTILKEIPCSLNECTYSGTSFRADVRNFLNDIEWKRPGTKYGVVSSLEKMLPYVRNLVDEKIVECEICGEPTSRSVCKACELLKEIIKV